MDLLHSPALVKQVAEQKAGEFAEFKKKVRSIPLSRFDSLAHPVVEEITHAIDCTQCGNCCKVQEPGVSMEEVEKLAELSHTPLQEFKDANLAFDRDGVSFLCHQPCMFLNGTRCSVYESRPLACADYPGLHRPRLKWRMKQLEENYGLCPIVFNVVEKLKHIIGEQC